MGMDATHAFVLDGSVTLAWGFTDENEDYATALLGKMPDLQAFVPNLWPLEVANALLVGERRGRTTPADVAHFLALLGTFPIAVDDETVAKAWVETMHLARACTLSAYDASYLELAMRLGLPLATLDNKLKTAANVVGVSLVTVP
jgi:predicted nucleic acid-binding protein